MEEFLSDYRDAVESWSVLALQQEQDRIMMLIQRLRGNPQPSAILYALERKLDILEGLITDQTKLSLVI